MRACNSGLAGDLSLAAVIPFPTDHSLRVLDVGCGTGDAGRVIHSRLPQARIDSVNRNEFFVSLWGAVNRRNGITGQTLVRDLSEPEWQRDLASDYDVVLAVNTVHWLSLAKAAELFRDIFSRFGQAASFCLWNLQERSRRSRPGSKRGKRNSQASTTTKIGGASGRE